MTTYAPASPIDRQRRWFHELVDTAGELGYIVRSVEYQRIVLDGADVTITIDSVLLSGSLLRSRLAGPERPAPGIER